MARAMTLTLSPYDVQEINVIGNRAEWAKYLSRIAKVGRVLLQENQAWELLSCVYADTEDGTKSLPLAPTLLAEKIWGFLYSIV